MLKNVVCCHQRPRRSNLLTISLLFVLFIQVEYWRNKDVGVIAKELSRLASENALKEQGIAWRIGNPCAYEEDIKVRSYSYSLRSLGSSKD